MTQSKRNQKKMGTLKDKMKSHRSISELKKLRQELTRLWQIEKLHTEMREQELLRMRSEKKSCLITKKEMEKLLRSQLK